jgi:hypothetical protein
MYSYEKMFVKFFYEHLFSYIYLCGFHFNMSYNFEKAYNNNKSFLVVVCFKDEKAIIIQVRSQYKHNDSLMTLLK